MDAPATARSTWDFGELGETDAWVDAYRELGYLRIRAVFDPVEIAEMRVRFDRWYAEGMRHPSTFRHRNKVIWIDENEQGRFVRGMQWPSYEDDRLDAVRTDPRMLAILAPLIGRDLKQIINQLHWKAPGSGITWGLHRDQRSRKPDAAFRDLANSYVQTGLAIDPHRAGNGAMKIGPRTHRLPRHPRDAGLGDHRDTGESLWAATGFDVSTLVDLEMDPGDVALWGPSTVHGGGINRTEDSFRRLYINGYVIAANCDRGEPVFRDGEPVPLDLASPALIQYDQLRSRPEAHYPYRDDPTARVVD